MNDDPLISVLMPVYNAERYVAGAVASVLAQTRRDFEFLIVDDGSTDRSRSIVEGFARRDGRVRVISRPNTGIVGALNDGLAAARGEFVARMDADDLCMPDRFARQVDYLRDNRDVVCVGTSYVVIDRAGRALTQLTIPLDDATIQSLNLVGQVSLCHPSVMLRRGALAAVGGYNPEIPLAQDLDLWLRLGEGGKLANLPDALLKYRVHPGAVSESRRAEQAAYARKASDQACDRRGIARCYRDPGAWRPGRDRASRHRFSLTYGWWAFSRGDRGTALRYGLRAVRWSPLSEAGWRLLACALAKPSRGPA